MKKILVVTTLLFVTLISAQSKSFKISGTLISEEDKAVLESATVYLERVKDSTLVTYTISDGNGSFVLEEETPDTKLNLLISYVGYQSYKKTISLDKSSINLGTIKMQIDANALDAILVKSRAPIAVKKDTLEFNVKSFKTKKDANIEDLLKVLPGVEIDIDGEITVNGKTVNKILVNGKPFFGNDPTITTRNLTKDIIEKIQVIDTKTKAQAFSGEDSDDENKTINLTIKKENNKGVFGRSAVGIGTDRRYEFAGMFNRFDNDQRLSVLLGGNNINSPGFSFGEIRKMFGGGYSNRSNDNGSFVVNGRSFGGGEGITTSRNTGFNFADELGETLDLSADYFYSSGSSENKTTAKRENILPDSKYYTDSESYSLSDNDNHSANLEFDIKVDSTLLINIEPSFRYTKSKTVFDREESSRDTLNVVTNESKTESVVETYGNNFSNNIDVTKRFGSKGAYLRLSVENEINNRNSDDFLTSETFVFGNSPSSLIRDQFTDGENKVNNFSTEINYNLPLMTKGLFMNFGYNYARDKRTDTQSTFDKDANGEYTLFNTDLSTEFIYIDEVKEPEVSINYRNKKLSARVKTSYLFRTLENNDVLRPEFNIKRDFEAIELSSRFRYRFSPKSSTYVGYRLNNSPPRLFQLQAFENVSDPLNTSIGNPNLNPSNTHRIYGGYNAFDFQKKTGLYTYLSANFINNAVVSKTIIDEDFVRKTTYANVNGNYTINAGVNYSKSVKVGSLKTIKYEFGLGGNSNRNINFNNGVQYASENTGITPNFELTFTWNDVIEFIPRYSFTYTKNKYDIESFEDREFVYHNLRLSTATFLPKHFEWRNEINYNYNPNISDDFQKSAWFWNSTLAYSLLKDKANLTLKAYDILNQNTNARRTANQNYIQDSQSTVLQRYFMLSFSWKFNSLGKKGEIDEA